MDGDWRSQPTHVHGRLRRVLARELGGPDKRVDVRRLSRRAVVGGLARLGGTTAGLMLIGGCGRLIPDAGAKHARIGILTSGLAPSASGVAGVCRGSSRVWLD